MKICLHPDYERYRDFVASLPLERYCLDEVFCNRRNLVGVSTMPDGQRVVVKRFKRPTIVNCVIYTFFRAPKTRRAYDNALALLEHGFDTARPIGYVEVKRHGLYHIGYFVQQYLPWPTLDQVISDMFRDYRCQSFVCGQSAHKRAYHALI